MSLRNRFLLGPRECAQPSTVYRSMLPINWEALCFQVVPFLRNSVMWCKGGQRVSGHLPMCRGTAG